MQPDRLYLGQKAWLTIRLDHNANPNANFLALLLALSEIMTEDQVRPQIASFLHYKEYTAHVYSATYCLLRSFASVSVRVRVRDGVKGRVSIRNNTIAVTLSLCVALLA